MEREDLEKIAGAIIKNNLIVVSDEIYAELTYLDKRHTSAAEIEGLKERTILINGFSKAFSMTGWRLGFLAAPAELTEQLTKIHQYILMCAPTTSQYAGIEALKNSAESVLKMKTAYNARRNVMVDGFRKMGLDVFEPLGAFYVFPSIKSLGMKSLEFCEKLLSKEKVAVVPGDAFGEAGEGFIRCSYAYSIDELKKALAGIKRFLAFIR
jgi:aminotransferase